VIFAASASGGVSALLATLVAMAGVTTAAVLGLFAYSLRRRGRDQLTAIRAIDGVLSRSRFYDPRFDRAGADSRMFSMFRTYAAEPFEWSEERADEFQAGDWLVLTSLRNTPVSTLIADARLKRYLFAALQGGRRGSETQEPPSRDG